MGTGGVKPEKTEKDAIRKIRAIETIVKNGRRGSEWQEAGLFCAIEKIINGADTSGDCLKKMIEMAAKY